MPLHKQIREIAKLKLGAHYDHLKKMVNEGSASNQSLAFQLMIALDIKPHLAAAMCLGLLNRNNTRYDYQYRFDIYNFPGDFITMPVITETKTNGQESAIMPPVLYLVGCDGRGQASHLRIRGFNDRDLRGGVSVNKYIRAIEQNYIFVDLCYEWFTKVSSYTKDD